MRNFAPPVRPELRAQIVDLVQQIIAIAPKTKQQFGRDLAMDDTNLLVSESTKVIIGDDGAMISLARSMPAARPPFEWLAEITSELEPSEYLKHYLVRQDDMVLAHRKVLTEVDDQEAEALIADLKLTREYLQ